MTVKKIIAVIISATVFCSSSGSATRIVMPDIIVVGSLTGGDAARDVDVITASEISGFNTLTPETIIGLNPSVSLNSRGPAGVQQDVSISGAGYEQSLILFDGIPVNDPQTGHFSMNIPVPVSALSRVEILNGHGSVTGGSGAMSGAVNFVPGMDPPGTSVELYGGSYSTAGGELVNSYSRNGISVLSGFSIRKTGDYHPQTDSYGLKLLEVVKYKSAGLRAAFLDKEFGAYDFYTPGWDMPSREWNRLYIISPTFGFENAGYRYRSELVWRRHYDRFLLDGDNPDFYENEHINDTFSGTFTVKKKGFIAGIEARTELMDSSSMGNHERSMGIYFGEFTFRPVNSLLLSGGMRYDDIAVPRIAAAWRLTEQVKIRGSWGVSYRRPTFTELYYNSPANTGNRELEPERGVNIEAGTDISLSSKFSVSTTISDRTIIDLIDWIGETENGPWIADNKGHLEIKSISILMKNRLLKPVSFRAGYAYSWLERKTQYYSKYALNYVRHRITGGLTCLFIAGTKFGVTFEAGVPENRSTEFYNILNCSISKRYGEFEAFLLADNITGSTYSDYAGIPVPGAWYSSGLRYSL